VDNRFSIAKLAPTWVRASEILKGDLPGHVFHGNQYGAAAAGIVERHLGDFANNSDASKAADKAIEISHLIEPTETSLRSVAKLHEAIADIHHHNQEEYPGGRDPSEVYPMDITSAPVARDAHLAVADYANHLADHVASGGTVKPEELDQLRSKIGGAADESDTAASEAGDLGVE